MPPPDTVHRARVLSTKPFGAFVKLAGFSKHGLVHISQLAPHRVDATEDVVRENDEVRSSVRATRRAATSSARRALRAGVGIRAVG